MFSCRDPQIADAAADLKHQFYGWRKFLLTGTSVNYDTGIKNDMDSASSIERRIAAMKQVYDAGIRTVCFVSPVFPGITDFEAIFERVKDQCDLFWLENLNLRGGFKKTIMDYIAGKYPDLVPLYDEIYDRDKQSRYCSILRALKRELKDVP